MTPRLRVEQACARLGHARVVAECNRLLAGDDVRDATFVVLLGGAHAAQLLASGAIDDPTHRPWLRVWAARGLLWAGAGDDLTALRVALTDESWRVREMACKVVARHRIGDLLAATTALEADRIARVRDTARRAARRIVEAQA